ncbi:MAG: DNA cytosine methyltransferase [Planctomycetota bacterium]|nr:MAG: DNA cytosine methyltransferase [Planctomycetota bacterium]REJ87324.1 MAG: DNA cytosine methyltransferase [Planctomycetota bacterium]REK22663.1 MAG: DNA cytosine methyltransferase [Planctomycetota bacterium]REK42504.1 MAG: DNA cytosine methyltransferase [Planctomycetota bacterium]
MPSKKRNGESIRTFDMFCGGGGSSRGAEMAGATLVGGLDMWDVAAKTHSLNFPDAKSYCMKASSLNPQRVVDEVGIVDLLLASPECTSHSVAKGNKPRCEESRATAFQVIRFAKILQPRWIVVENVMQMQHWHRFVEWRKKIELLGYNSAFAVLDAQRHGTPQSRRRLFFVADLLQEPRLPKPGRLTKKTVDSAVLGKGESKSNPWEFSPVHNSRRAKATIERAGRAIDELGKKTPFIMVYYGTDGAGGYQTIDRPLRTITTLDRFAYVRPNYRGHEMRMLQPPELAAAMGFPRHHKWPKVSRRERIKLTGNAVCPRVMRDVVKSLTATC